MFVVFLTLLLAANIHNTGAEYEAPEFDNSRFLLNAVIRQLFELIRNAIQNGNEEMNVPVMDPYEFDHASVDIKGQFTRFSANITNGTLTGLGGYQLGPFDFTKPDLSLEMDLNIPLISFLSEYYEMEGKVTEMVAISGKGLIQIEARNILVQGKIYLKQSSDGNSVLISHFENAQFTIGSIESHTEFGHSTDAVFNVMVGDLLAGYLNQFSRAICAAYGDMLIQTMNSYLEKFKTWHIIAVIL